MSHFDVVLSLNDFLKFSLLQKMNFLLLTKSLYFYGTHFNFHNFFSKNVLKFNIFSIDISETKISPYKEEKKNLSDQWL